MNVLAETARLMRHIDGATAPHNASQEEALALLEELQGEIETRIDGLREDLR